MSEPIPPEALFNPSEYGYEVCAHCTGYGSSLQDPIGVDRCTVCGGSGLVKSEKEENK